MALTKFNFYLSTITLFIIVFSGIAYVGTSLVNKDRITLDTKSIDYLLEVKGINTQTGVETIANTTGADSQVTDILDSENDTQVSDNNDFLSTLYIKKERASQPTNYFKLVYNIPSSIIKGLGFNIADWVHYINIIMYLLVISILIMVWTKLINP